MKYKAIPQTELNASKLCLGTMTFGMQNTIQDAFNQLDMATNNGINFIDTAELYPSPVIDINTMYETENYIGKWLKQSNINRQDLILLSKVMGQTNKHRPNPNPLQPQTIKKSIDGTLNRLRTDYLDIYLVHWPLRNSNFFRKLGYIHTPEDFDVNEHILQTIKVMDELIKQGKIRHYGISNEAAWGIMKYIQLAEQHNLAKPVLVQNPYSLLNRSYEVGGAEVSHRENIGFMSYATLASGLLSGKHIKNIQPNSRIDLYPDYFQRYTTPSGLQAIEKYVDLAHYFNISPTTLAISFALSKPFMTSAIIGATSTIQLQQLINAINTQLSSEILIKIDEIHRQHTYPCP